MHAEHADSSELNELPGRLTRGRMQCANYPKATGLQLCLLLNFGKPRLEIKRVAHDL